MNPDRRMTISSKNNHYFWSCSSEMWPVSGIHAEISTGPASRSIGCCVSGSSSSWLNKRSYVACVSCCISVSWVLATCLWMAACSLKVCPQQHQDVLPSSWLPSLLDATKAANDCEKKTHEILLTLQSQLLFKIQNIQLNVFKQQKLHRLHHGSQHLLRVLLIRKPCLLLTPPSMSSMSWKQFNWKVMFPSLCL